MNDDKDVIIHKVPETRIYLNEDMEIVINQSERDYGDSFVYFPVNQISLVVKKLRELEAEYLL